MDETESPASPSSSPVSDTWTIASDQADFFGDDGSQQDQVDNHGLRSIELPRLEELTLGVSTSVLWPPLGKEIEIRLLRIAPSTDLVEPVQLFFETRDLVSLLGDGVENVLGLPPYHALSYAWGDIQPDGLHLTDIVLLEGVVVRVTAHLNWALRRIRQLFVNCPAEDEVPVPRFWVDALCINQRDDQERMQQVSIMGSVFAEAQSVLIWLGELEIWELYAHGEISQVDLWNMLVDQPYFGRRWVIQEVLGARALSVLVSEHVTTLRQLRQATNAPSLVKRAMNNDPRQYPLLSNLIVHGSSQCSDPRDRVYSLLAFSSDGTKLPPDYSKDVEQVYAAVAKLYVESQYVPVLLACAVESRRVSSCSFMPFWTPDWAADSAEWNALRKIDPIPASWRSDVSAQSVQDGQILRLRTWVWWPCIPLHGRPETAIAPCSYFQIAQTVKMLRRAAKLPPSRQFEWPPGHTQPCRNGIRHLGIVLFDGLRHGFVIRTYAGTAYGSLPVYEILEYMPLEQMFRGDETRFYSLLRDFGFGSGVCEVAPYLLSGFTRTEIRLVGHAVVS